jgi:SlyX protein
LHSTRAAADRTALGKRHSQQGKTPFHGHEFLPRARMSAIPSQQLNFQGTSMIENRLVNIETKIAFHEDAIEELNKVVYLQQKKLGRLEAICESLVRHIESLEKTENGSSAANERPPHY